MAKKKLEVVELNKEKEKIVLEEKNSPLIIFFKKHRWLILFILLLLSLIFLGISTYIFLDNIGKSQQPTIENAEIETTLDKVNTISGGNIPITEEYAAKLFIETYD